MPLWAIAGAAGGCFSGRERRLGGETGAYRLVIVGSFPFLSWHSFFAEELSISSSTLRARFMIVVFE